jgi:hypothetical protein
MFLKHAKLHNKLKDNDTLVALLNESCKILIGNPYMQGPSIQRPPPIIPNMPAMLKPALAAP